jgi:hypothetical protein
MKIRVSNSLFVILVSAVLWQPVSAAADSYDPPARVWEFRLFAPEPVSERLVIARVVTSMRRNNSPLEVL